jgi:hypothetical protein
MSRFELGARIFRALSSWQQVSRKKRFSYVALQQAARPYLLSSQTAHHGIHDS